MENQNTVQTVQEGEQAEAVPPSGLRREVKTYVLRAGRMTAAQGKSLCRACSFMVYSF